MKAGTMVLIKKEWLDPGEDPTRVYVVLEDRGDRSVFAIVPRAGDLEHALTPTWCWSDDTVEPIGNIFDYPESNRLQKR